MSQCFLRCVWPFSLWLGKNTHLYKYKGKCGCKPLWSFDFNLRFKVTGINFLNACHHRSIARCSIPIAQLWASCAHKLGGLIILMWHLSILSVEMVAFNSPSFVPVKWQIFPRRLENAHVTGSQPVLRRGMPWPSQDGGWHPGGFCSCCTSQSWREIAGSCHAKYDAGALLSHRPNKRHREGGRGRERERKRERERDKERVCVCLCLCLCESWCTSLHPS